MTSETENKIAITSKRVMRMILGLGLETWNNLMVEFLAAGALFAVLAAGATYAALKLQKQETAAAELEYRLYKETVAGQVADATKAGIAAGKAAGGAILEAAKANERAAGLEKEAAGLRLELEKVRAPLVDRRLKPDQIDALAKSLSGKKIVSILIAPSPDREINTFAKDLLAAFAKAGTPFDVTFIAGAMRQDGINAVPDGLNVSGDPGPNRDAIEAAFHDANIPFGSEPITSRSTFIEMPGAAYVTIGFRAGIRERE